MTPADFRTRATALSQRTGPLAALVRAAWFEAVSDWCVCGHSQLHHKTSTEDLDLCRVCDDCPEEGFTAKSSPLPHDGTDRHEAMLLGALNWALENDQHGARALIPFEQMLLLDLDAVMTMLESAASEVTP